MPSKVALSAAPNQQNGCHRLPDNWPVDVTYLTDLTYTAAVTAEVRAGLSRPTVTTEVHARIAPEDLTFPSTLARIQIIADEKHPAYGQRGLFAAQHLAPEAFIIIYLGQVHTNSLSDTDPKSDYDLNLDGELGLSVDGANAGCEARFANDYRGIAERPNAEFRDCFVQVPSTKRAGGVKWEKRTGIFVFSAGKAGHRKAGIKQGEEILISYGKGYWESRKTMGKFRGDPDMVRIATAALDA